MAHKRAFAWLDHFSIAELGDKHVTLVPGPDQRGMLSLATEARRNELSAQLREILGRPVNVYVREPGDNDAAPGESSDTQPKQATEPSTGGARQQAMELPLVREALEQFPNATLTHVQRHDTTSATPSTEFNPPSEGTTSTDQSEADEDLT